TDTESGGGVEETQTASAESSDTSETYLIQRGDNLLTILRNHYGDDSMLQEVCEVNQIEDADNIQVGQTIVLP
ncbi:MAG: LysM peptidoglycan-binding domain-containing protein, partial [Lachnospiraceae bacterium]|nr:LysM peptidoglycan-binding domain-containing protein [Lachnospiraceae bacterium]